MGGSNPSAQLPANEKIYDGSDYNNNLNSIFISILKSFDCCTSALKCSNDD